MTERINPAGLLYPPTRRQVATSMAMALLGLASTSSAWAQSPQPPEQEKPGTSTNQKRTSLQEDIQLKSSPQRIYGVLLDAKQFAACTGQPAEIDPKAGGAFSLFAGQIVGRNVELVPNQRIVQAWRPSHWTPGIWSLVAFELKPQASGTLLSLDHKGFPVGDFDHLQWGWHEHYWEPLKKFLT
jgi:activator of HSP90 ATPase